MELKHLQAMAAVALSCSSVLLDNATGYTTIGKIVKVGEVKQTESDTAAQHGRVEKSIGRVYVSCEVKTEKDEIKAEAKPQETTAALQSSAAKTTEVSKAKTAQESTVLALDQGGSETAQKNGSTTQALLAPAEPRDSTATTAATTDNTTAVSEQKKIDMMALSYDVSQFTLPVDTKSLIVVEGFAAEGGKDTYRKTKVSDESRQNKTYVTTFVRDEAGQWQTRIQSAGIYGFDGMSATRHSGDDTTPVGLQKTSTPFGRSALEEGFPSDYMYIQAKAKRQRWFDRTNRLESATKVAEQRDEKLWEDWVRDIYAYALNTSFNKDNRQPGADSALFLHCMSNDKPSTTSCAAIQPEAIEAVLRQYAKDNTYTAQAPEGQFEQVYGAFSESGATTKGEFKVSTRELPAAKTVVLQ